jgi:DNA polymerase III delta' subunit
MTDVQWKKLVGQERIKEVFAAALRNDTLGHAYLFCGENGCGTFAAAVELAQSLLCERRGTVPCYECSSCTRVRRHEHTDFQVICPVSLQKEHKKSNENKLTEEGWQFLHETVARKIADPYSEIGAEGIPAIPLEWIHEISQSILRGAVSGSRNVAVLCDVDTLNPASANALLKILEEPPSNTFMILTTMRPQSVLPTIASRCQIVRFGSLQPEQILESLRGCPEGMKLAKDQLDTIVTYAMGSLGRAMYYLRNPLDEDIRRATRVWELVSGGNWMKIIEFIDTVSKEDNYGSLENLFYSCMHMVRQGLLEGMTNSVSGHGTKNPIEVEQGEKLLWCCQNALSAIRAYGTIGLIMANFFIRAMEILNGKEQQSG